MKRTISILLAVSLMATMLLSAVTVSAAVNYNEWVWNYKSSTKVLQLQGYRGTNTNLTAEDIPVIVNGAAFLAATGIDLTGKTEYGATGSGLYAIDSMLSFDYSTTVTDIRTSVKLNSIQLPYGVRTLAANSFRNQNLLTTFFVPDSVEVLDNNTFVACNQMDYIVISKNIATLGTTCFQNLNTSTKIYFRSKTPPASVSTPFWSGNTANLYVPEGDTPAETASIVAAYEAVTWVRNNGPFTVHTYSELPAAAKTYYQNIGSGVTPEPDEGVVLTASVEAGNLVIDIEGAEKAEGVLTVAVYDSVGSKSKLADVVSSVVSSDGYTGDVFGKSYELSDYPDWAGLKLKVMFWESDGSDNNINPLHQAVLIDL